MYFKNLSLGRPRLLPRLERRHPERLHHLRVLRVQLLGVRQRDDRLAVRTHRVQRQTLAKVTLHVVRRDGRTAGRVVESLGVLAHL